MCRNCNLRERMLITIRSCLMLHFLLNRANPKQPPASRADRQRSASALCSVLASQVGAGVLSDSQVEVLRCTFPSYAAISVSPSNFGGEGLPLYESLFTIITFLQTGNDHFCQILLEPLEVFPADTSSQEYICHFYFFNTF